MDSLLNKARPPVFCPGCAHDNVLRALDRALVGMEIPAEQIVIVTDIGCSGLFDVFFNTHAFHGLHGRALTYATGIKMARPDLTVIVTMGDGGLGIGGAHVMSTCRRNIDVTLLVLNNFNYGMTGGQCSCTTPQDAQVGSGFLNRLEMPLDICQVAGASGAGRVARVSSYQKDLETELTTAIAFDGFSLLDIWGLCPGRYTRQNKLTPKSIEAELAGLPSVDGYTAANQRMEYGKAYRQEAESLSIPPDPVSIEPICAAPWSERQELIILGSAGQRIITAGELLCLAGASTGCHATQKNDYPITVMRGHSVSEVILSPDEIGYTGIDAANVVIALANEGVQRRKTMFSMLKPDALVIKAADVELPPCSATAIEVDFKTLKIKPQDRALAALAVLVLEKLILTKEMLDAALKLRFKGDVLAAAGEVLRKVAAPTG